MGLRDNLKVLCQAEGMSISGLEQKLGYGNGALKKTDNIRLDRLTELANYFHVSIDEIVGFEMKPEDYEGIKNPRVHEIKHNSAVRQGIIPDTNNKNSDSQSKISLAKYVDLFAGSATIHADIDQTDLSDFQKRIMAYYVKFNKMDPEKQNLICELIDLLTDEKK